VQIVPGVEGDELIVTVEFELVGGLGGQGELASQAEHLEVDGGDPARHPLVELLVVKLAR